MILIEVNHKYIKQFEKLAESFPNDVSVLHANGIIDSNSLVQIILTLSPAILVAIPAILREIFEASNKRKEREFSNREEISVKRKMDNDEYELVLKVDPKRLNKKQFNDLVKSFIDFVGHDNTD